MLWLWYRLAAVAPIRPLAWEPLYAMDVAPKAKKKKKRKKEKGKEKKRRYPPAAERRVSCLEKMLT